LPAEADDLLRMHVRGVTETRYLLGISQRPVNAVGERRVARLHTDGVMRTTCHAYGAI